MTALPELPSWAELVVAEPALGDLEADCRLQTLEANHCAVSAYWGYPNGLGADAIRPRLLRLVERGSPAWQVAAPRLLDLLLPCALGRDCQCRS
jgi:hypothetical protein